ncbi:MAG: hypothetical protein JO287_11285 [Pseudonocardiales bacterium]|nr:hypothetical protein [Pseudonocardiales bacterium]
MTADDGAGVTSRRARCVYDRDVDGTPVAVGVRVQPAGTDARPGRTALAAVPQDDIVVVAIRVPV